MKVSARSGPDRHRGALWGAIHHQGFLQDTVIVSDDAGQFRVGVARAVLGSRRAARPQARPRQRQTAQRHRGRQADDLVVLSLLERIQARAQPRTGRVLRARFDRIFKRASTGYATLDSLLKRLSRNKAELLRVLERPEIPLNTNASENDIRAFVTKRKISGGTVSEKGRDARDVMLGLYKTCMKLKLSFYHFIGDRLGIPGPKIPPLATLVRPAPS